MGEGENKHHAASREPLGNTDTLDSTAVFC